MASCDDNDFSLLSDDNQTNPNPNHHLHHQHHHLHTQPHQHHHLHSQPAFVPCFSSKSSAVLLAPPNPPSPNKLTVASEVGESGGDAPFHDPTPFSVDENFGSASDPTKSRSDKRRSHEELSDGGTPTPYDFKKCKSAGMAAGSASSEYRKDREEWSDAAITCLLEAYTEKYTTLNRGNLRGRDWEEVAAIVSERCDKQTKSVEQCKNKVDNLKKRYKLERQRMSSGGISASHWPWYKKLEEIVGNSLMVKSAVDEDKGGGGGGVSSVTARQSKR